MATEGQYSTTEAGQLSTFKLSDPQEKNIEILCTVAALNGDSLSTAEIVRLASLGVQEWELQEAWKKSKLSTKFKLNAGRVTKNFGQRAEAEFYPDHEQAERIARYNRAASGIAIAKKFGVGKLLDGNLKVLSISGSASYFSLSEQDDLDFFCITRKDSAWLFLAKALILARLFRLTEPKCPPLCFSYIVDADKAAEIFASNRNALFARDALSAIVIDGKTFYSNLLRQNQWMASYFPSLYSRATSESNEEAAAVNSGISDESSTSPRKILNLFFLYTLSNYIRLKSHLLNRRFAKSGDNKRLFEVKASKDQCVFESRDYVRLLTRYSEFSIVQGSDR